MKRTAMPAFKFLLVLGFLLYPAQARAQVLVEMVNNTSSRAYVCFKYHDQISGEWLTRGWWMVEPKSARKHRLNTDDPNISYYAYNRQGRSWGGREGAADSFTQHVVLENFFVKKNYKPRGKTHRMAVFKTIRASGGQAGIVMGN
ncbi:MAG: DUF1036 domain-containing protein [Candidatus Adiutrix sp.]|jgi:uncharacterized membrane protein|nr:DUF1036 domain-containing protein [Candidatus Adiutrix sp.]